MSKVEALCPCGGGLFSTCCGRFIASQDVPQTAQELMRSRYTAFTLCDDTYLRATWHHSTRPKGGITDAETKWLGLEVRNSGNASAADANHATVDFVARYKVAGRAHRLHEISNFVREQEKGSNDQEWRWFYVDGVFPQK
ncbi:YchJ family protein [Glaciimonas soli]|uniref:YchJ-like middle NTF2-like domain-containing protein n=1 Tax=Glaciimonas soli TaxID=2590999 RepID=A0A843YUB6_9BURK|nr:YchJ family metal-binding protein [Glaciimonas soli]MQR00921.1 hypothetical protein [Glaciimonas soli]